MMTVADIRKRIEAIRAEVGDNETAHIMEDALHQDVLRAIALGACVDPERCASAALETLDIDFERWHA